MDSWVQNGTTSSEIDSTMKLFFWAVVKDFVKRRAGIIEFLVTEKNNAPESVVNVMRERLKQIDEKSSKR